MKLRSIKPIYYQGNVLTEGSDFETPEQHGRELIQRGYAEAPDSKKVTGDTADSRSKGKTK